MYRVMSKEAENHILTDMWVQTTHIGKVVEL